MDTIVNIFFFIDILINFRTTFYNKRGEEVFSGKIIALTYLKGEFTLDLLACIPFTSIIHLDSDYLKVAGLSKLWRITRINAIL
jgi:hypothetical protein